jgi:hypothetical protein
VTVSFSAFAYYDLAVMKPILPHLGYVYCRGYTLTTVSTITTRRTMVSFEKQACFA